MKYNKISIKAPIWKTRSVGIAEDKIADITDVEIEYVTKDGKKLYPFIYRITRELALKYPIQDVKGHRLHLVPIADLKAIAPEESKPPIKVTIEVTQEQFDVARQCLSKMKDILHK